MSVSHKGSILPIKNRVLSVDENTAFLAHYDLNENDVLNGTGALGNQISLEFDGSDQYAECIASDALQMTENALTTEAWVFPTAQPNSDRGIIIIGHGNNSYYFTIDSSLHISVYWYGRTTSYLNSVGTLPLNEWSHIAASWTTTDVSFYINGVFDSTKAIAGVGNTTAKNIRIGGEGNNRRFLGKVNDIRIWRTARSENTIKDSMHRVIQEDATLAAWWKCNEDEGLILRDSSMYKHDAVMNTQINYSTGNSVFTLREAEGYFGGGVAVEEETENLVATYGWETSGEKDIVFPEPPPVTPVISSHVNMANWQRLFITNPNQKTLANNESFSVSGWFYTKYNRGEFNCNLSTSVNSNQGTGHRLTKKGWSYLEWNFTNTTGSDITINSIRVEAQYTGTDGAGAGSGWPNGDNEAWGCNYQIEWKPFSTSFVDGIRSRGKLEYQIDLIGDFTISLYYKSVAPEGYSSDRDIFALTNGTNDFNFFNGYGKDWYMGDENSRTRFRLNDKSVQQTSFENLVVVRSGTIIKLYRDGNLTDSKDFGSAPIFTKMAICGGYGLQTDRPNGIIDELRIDRVARTDEEIRAWYYCNSPFWPRGIYRKA